MTTSMGFTPLDGLVMGRRPGRLDPGAVLWLIEEAGLAPAEVNRMLNRDSGLVGLSGGMSDMRALLEAGTAEAAFAVEVFVDRLVQEIGGRRRHSAGSRRSCSPAASASTRRRSGPRLSHG